jgi:hypothetical protein
MMKKIIDELINNSIEGVDVYRYNDATWLIFTDENRWVVEMTDGGTLWYNYKFFNDIMRYVSMDPKEYEGYITEWANDYFFKEIKKSQMGIPIDGEFAVDIVINDGVKKMGDSNSIRIQNRGQNLTWRIVKDAKPNVVFHGINNSSMSFVTCNGNSTHIHKIVEEGIKNTMPSKATSKRGIHYDDLMCSGNRTDISLIVEGGIKNTWPDKIPHDYDWSDEFDADKVIEVGVKL